MTSLPYIISIPKDSISRPSGVLMVLRAAMAGHRDAGRGITLSSADLGVICDALGDLIPAVQTMEAAIEIRIAEAEAAQPSAEIILFRPQAPHNVGGSDVD